MRSIIVGTAGHIDHGKTALVRALTGIDADRLPEEKRRGITIDLGFAELDLDDVRIGFIDVPGHERFVKNMLAGAHGIDLVALVIAADEGVMPQTREHFDICRLLGVQHGLVIITKTDAVDHELLALVRAEAEELVAESFLAGAPVVSVSARTGSGLEDLKSALRSVALQVPGRSTDLVARLPIDRAFIMRGFGAVVTGTLTSGSLTEGAELELLPAGSRVRIRGLQVHGSQVKTAVAGQRTAINLGGIEVHEIERGMVLAPPGRLKASQVLDVEVNVLANASRPLRSRVRVRVHIGAAEVLARVRVLEPGDEIAPGNKGLAQLRLEMPVVASPTEHFIIRSYSPQRTIAGGRVLDPHATKHRGREASNARSRLATLASADRATEFAVFVVSAGEKGLSRSETAARMGVMDEVLDDALRQAVSAGSVIDADGVYIGSESYGQLAKSVGEEVEAHHKREPLTRGLSRETLRERLFAHVPAEVFRSVLAHLEYSGTLVAEKEIVRAASHRLSLTAPDEAVKERLERVYREAALEAPTFDEAVARAEAASLSRDHVRKIFQLLIDNRSIVKVGADLYFHRPTLDRLVEKLRVHASTEGSDRTIGVPAFKEIANISRKFAIPLLEYFDRERITRRAGDKRIIL
ncbi:MAG: selenocysteine-specific elongation factor [Acidobacteriota bacterium]|nr:selenocysteine-specific elongation factor [Acidobacteriota bacterium]